MINRTVEELFASHRHTERTPSQLLSIFRYPSERFMMMMMMMMMIMMIMMMIRMMM